MNFHDYMRVTNRYNFKGAYLYYKHIKMVPETTCTISF